ncbi:erythromycin esterase family protein [Streptomyces armeniacus]|uniref:Erythromycin esterase family protein n=1 Tax=Streptomyces armeniacus TaxID=83291 RepID=A0A345XLN6_9ACTN|nr:erythromycin esterase family protein [Streptomyces armeniacus]AXK32552.1 erythromycin esterase family protein [Streptomyces armeniacus]
MPLVSRRTLLAALPALALTVTAGGPARAGARSRAAGPDPGPAAGPAAGPRAKGAETVLAALARASRPLRSVRPNGDLSDLRPLGAAIGRSAVVGLGEAAHGARELFTLRHRVFRYLVEEKGFTTFALETNWAAGLRINDFVRHGTGEPRAIMAEEFGNGKWPWNVREYLNLITWMREHNLRNPDRQVQFMGNDLAYPRIADTLFERVLGYVTEHHPSLRPMFGRLYRELWAHAEESDFSALPQPERRRMAGQARHAVALLEGLRPEGGRPSYAWTVQHARVVAQTATLLSYDLEDERQIPEAMRYRDELMARNTAWWHRNTGHRILLAAHNGHTAYETYAPARYPRTQGAYLRKLLGDDYLSVGTTFGRGAATVPGDDGGWETTKFGPPREGSSEELLDRVVNVAGSRNFLLDLRSAPPAARAWLNESRVTRDIGPPGDPYRPFVLGDGHSVLIHLHRFRSARPLS